MHSDQQIKHWTPVCELAEIVPNTGVAALIGDQQVAIFHVIDRSQGEPQPRVFAIGNYDPNAQAAVLSRGLVGNLGERIVVASPIYKHHFDLTTGQCLEEPANSVPAWPARIGEGKVWIGG